VKLTLSYFSSEKKGKASFRGSRILYGQIICKQEVWA
jgi:hypothetical protein